MPSVFNLGGLGPNDGPEGHPVFVDESGHRRVGLRAAAVSGGTVVTLFAFALALAAVGTTGGEPGQWARLAVGPAATPSASADASPTPSAGATLPKPIASPGAQRSLTTSTTAMRASSSSAADTPGSATTGPSATTSTGTTTRTSTTSPTSTTSTAPGPGTSTTDPGTSTTGPGTTEPEAPGTSEPPVDTVGDEESQDAP